MRKKLKRLLAMVMVVSMTMSLLSGMASAAEKTSDIQIVKQGGKIYYLADPQEGAVAGEDNFDVWTSKTIAGTENEDEFEVTLQVGTTMKAIPNDVAVVLVMDASGSMTRDKNGKQWSSTGELPTDGTKLRIDYAREAALEFADQLVENSGGAERMVSVVEFGNNAMTVLPWTDANANGSLNQKVADAISSVDVNFVIDNRSFWDEDFWETWPCEVHKKLNGDKVAQAVKPENWSDELYTHETKSFFEANFASYDQSFMSDYVTTMVTETVEEGGEVTRCTYPGCEYEGAHTHCTVDGCTDSANHSHCTYSGCRTEVSHTHCTHKGCKSDVADHKHCAVCGVSDADAPDDTHCAFAGCTETAEHTHCTYSICANPAGHKHCERACWCEEDHAHCKDLQVVCGRTDEHQHITGCTVFFCQDTTPNHKHACLHGAVTSDKEVYKYPFYVQESNTYLEASARCLNSDPSHTHDVYDGDTYRDYYGDPYYMSLNRVYGSFCTNLEGGLMLARNLLNTGKADGGAIKGIDDVYVILLSDGCPTYHVNQELLQNADTEVEFLPGERGGGNYAKWDDLKDIVIDGESNDVAIAEDIKAGSDFYAIMYGTEMGQKLGYTPGGAHYGAHDLYKTTALEWFQTANDPQNGIIKYVGAHEVFVSTEADELNTVFANINKRIDVLAKAWVVTDEMGGIELGDDVTFEEFTLNGEYAAATPATNSKNTTVSWSLGAMEPESGNGSMADPYIYTLKYKVTLNSAKDNVKATSLAYGAGTSKEAVWTNNGASLQYFMVKDKALDDMTPDEIAANMRTAAFKKPSVKGIYGDFTFIKKNGKTDEVMKDVGFTLFDSEDRAYGAEVFSNSEGKVTFTGIPRGEYTLKETTVPEEMQQMSDLDLKVSWGEVTCNGQALSDIIQNWPVTVKVEGKKTWEDENNYDGLRPESITINLLADGEEVDSKTVTAANGWKWSFTDLDKYKDGKEIEYTITEDTVEGYETKVEGYDVTNTHTVEKVAEISGKKTWVDNNDQDGLRPESITINLLANGEKIDSKVVTSSNGWKWRWSDLDKYKNGKAINYTITEDAVPGYSAEVKGYDVINSYTPGKTSLTVNKVWKDDGNRDGIRPTSISVQLLADGAAKGEPVTLTAESGWTYTWTGLDEMSGGKAISYTVAEVGTVAGYTSSVNGFTITNTHEVKKTSIDVEKVWERTSNPPEIDVIIKLLADGEEVNSLALNEANNWKGTFADLPVNKDGKAITYTIEEVEVSGYTTKITGSADEGFVVTNTKKDYDRPGDDEEDDGGSATYTLTADKTLDGKKASGFTFEVKDSTGTVVATASAKNGKITFPTFKYDAEGTYTYTVSEAAGTNSNVIYDDSVYTLTVTVSKNGEDLVAACTGLEKDGESVEAIRFENTYDGERFYDDDEEELFEEDIPLGGLAAPETGDAGMLWALTAAVSGMGLAGLNFFPKKRKEDEE